MSRRVSTLLLVLAVAVAGCSTVAKMGYNLYKGPQGTYEIISGGKPNFNDYYELDLGAVTSDIGNKCPAAFLAAVPTEVAKVIGSEPYFGVVEGINNPNSPKSAGKTLMVSGVVVDYSDGSVQGRAIGMGEGTFVTVKTTFKQKGGKTLCVANIRGRSKSVAEGGYDALAEAYAKGILKLVKDNHMKLEKVEQK